MLLFKHVDPTLPDRMPRERLDALRALGLTEHNVHMYSSDALPKLVLSPTSTTMAPSMTASIAWAIWGNLAAAAGAIEHLESYGGGARGVANAHEEVAYNLMVTFAISAYIDAMQSQYASLRDDAARRHGRFSARSLNDLRRALLSSSLDLNSVHADLRAHWDRRYRLEGDVDVIFDLHPAIRRRDQREGFTAFEAVEMRKYWRKQQRSEFKRLLAADSEYRQILSTVASLGSSADAYKTGRIALVVALASLIVAAVTLAVTDPSSSSVLRIANTGRTSLPPDDWSGPLEVRTQGSNVLAASHSGARPIGLEVQITVTGDRVLVEPFLFNARDLIELTITTDLPTTVLVHGRIKDVRNIGRKRYVYPPGTGVDGAITTADKVMSLVVFPALFVVLLVLGLVRGTAEVQMMAPWWFLGLTLGYFAFLRWSITRSRLWRPDLG